MIVGVLVFVVAFVLFVLLLACFLLIMVKSSSREGLMNARSRKHKRVKGRQVGTVRSFP